MTTTETHFIEKEPNRDEAELAALVNEISTLDAEQIVRVIRYFENKWDLCGPAGERNHLDADAENRIGFRPGQFFKPEAFGTDGYPIAFHVREVEQQADMTKLKLKQIGYRLDTLPAVNELPFRLSRGKDDDEMSLEGRLNEILSQVYEGLFNVRRFLKRREQKQNRFAVPLSVSADPDCLHDTFLTTQQLEEFTPYQRSLYTLLNELNQKGYRRYMGNCMEQLETEDGFFSRAWKPVCTVKEFCYGVAQMEDKLELWKDLTTKGSGFNDATRYLENCVSGKFPDIKKTRYAWSFKNGIFIGKEFVGGTSEYASRFYAYGTREFATLDPSIVSAKYFDQDFPDYTGVPWQEIPTPHFDSILKYQGFADDVKLWTYVFSGRGCFDLNDLDGWQVITFFKGVARSGKSTLVTRVLKKFYENVDVRVLSNNIEAKFGLSSIVDSLMFLAPEIKGDLSLEQAEFQSIVSGEDVSVAVKNQQARNLVWKTPGFLAGNEVPHWKDNSGSILRRLVTWNFGKQVHNADTHLDRKLEAELPLILQKCVRAYLDYARRYGHMDVWNVLPPYFKKIQDALAKNVSTLTHFMMSPEVRYGPDLCIPQKEFVQLLNQHCSINNLGRPRFNEDYYAGPFSSRDIRVEQGVTRTWEGKAFKNQPFIYGLTVDTSE